MLDTTQYNKTSINRSMYGGSFKGEGTVSVSKGPSTGRNLFGASPMAESHKENTFIR